MTVIKFTPEGEGKKELMRLAEDVADDCEGWALITWDNEFVGISLRNETDIPDSCLPEYLYRKLAEYFQ